MFKDNDQTESLLRDGLVQPPSDFRDRVMLQVAEHEQNRLRCDQSEFVKNGVSVKVPWWQWVILLPSSVIGAAQMMRYVFSFWLVTTAG